MKLYIFDGSALVYRAFYALPEMTNSRGLHTNAVFGVARMLAKFIKEHIKEGDHVIFVLDSKEKNFRHTLFQQYKANRKPAPAEMVEQMPYVERFICAMGMPLLKETGYEADDVIATIAKKYSSKFESVYIVTGDKDLLQLVDGNVRVLRFSSTGVSDLQEYNEKVVMDKYGLKPSQIGDYLALVGDKVDNVPGVKGVGEKTATKLLKDFGTLEEIYANLSQVPKRAAKLLEAGREDAALSKALVTLSCNVPVELKTESYAGPDKKALLALFEELEFSSLKKEFELYEDVETRKKLYTTVKSLEELKDVFEKAKKEAFIAFDTETTSVNAIDAELVGFSVAWKKKSFYVPLGHKKGVNLSFEKALEELRSFLSDESVKIVGQNLKYDLSVMKKYEAPFAVYFDTMIAAYLLNPNERRFSLDNLAMKYLNYNTVKYEDVTVKGENFADVPIEVAARYSAEDADVTYRLYEKLSKEIQENGLTRVFYDMEMPLVDVLSTMEMNGVYIDVEYLNAISKKYAERLLNIEDRIYALAGMPFNINSPKQVGEVLFHRLGLKPTKRTKTHAFSTSAKVLEEMKEEHEIIPLLLDYRKYFKLKSTYLDALPKMVNPKTSRVHTSFNQTGTSTGRLSSSDPNLQNIPARNEEGREIRRAIRAQKTGWIILSADYSQIELRILAHLSGDPALVQAFKDGVDVHLATASKVFGVKENDVTKEMRRVGKMVNFAVIYGVSPYGLSKRLGISNSEAKDLISNYFRNYPKVREYLDYTIEFARKNGYVETVFGRKRSIPGINSQNGRIREEAKRMAVNAPIQGSAADVIKLAMLRIHEKLKKMKAMMIMQVHDELVFELPKGEEEVVGKLVKENMENVVKLAVPLLVYVEKGERYS